MQGKRVETVAHHHPIFLPGYGSRGAGGKIPGGATLVFDGEYDAGVGCETVDHILTPFFSSLSVELLEIQGPRAAAAKAAAAQHAEL